MKRLRCYLALAAGGILCALPVPASAYDWVVEANVTVIEPSYVPATVGFTADAGAGSCPAGAWLNWFAKGEDSPSKIANVQAVLAVLMTAKASHVKVRLHGNNAGCTIDFIHLL